MEVVRDTKAVADELAAVWSAVLDRTVELNAPGFVTLGGTSLLAAYSVLAAREHGVHVSVHEVLANEPLLDLAERVCNRPPASGHTTQAGSAHIVPSLAQEAMLERRRRSYVAFTALLDGDVDIVELERSLRSTAFANDVLRMRFSHTGRVRVDGSVRAVPHLHVVESVNQVAIETALEQWLAEYIGSVENSSALYCSAGERSMFAFVADHLLFDAESVRPFLHELSRWYSADGIVPPAPRTAFAEFASGQRTAFNVLPDSVEHWRRIFGEIGPFPAVSLPGLKPRTGIQAPRAMRTTRGVRRAVVARFDQAAARLGYTPFVAYTAALLCAVHRLTGKPTRVGVNTATAGRNWPGTESAIGPFADIITVDLGMSTDNFTAALAAVRAGVLDALAHDRIARVDLMRNLCQANTSTPCAPFVWITPPLDFSSLEVPLGDRAVIRDVRLHLGAKPVRRPYPGVSVEVEYVGEGAELVCEYGEGEYEAHDSGRLLDGWASVIAANAEVEM